MTTTTGTTAVFVKPWTFATNVIVSYSVVVAVVLLYNLFTTNHSHNLSSVAAKPTKDLRDKKLILNRQQKNALTSTRLIKNNNNNNTIIINTFC